MGKRGLSDVVTTVLIILFAIVAVAIIGGIVLNQVNKAGEKVKSQQLCLTNNVEVLNCMQVGTEARVKYRRATDNDVKGVQDLKVGLTYTDGNNANPVSGDISLGAGEVRIIGFTDVPSDKEVSNAFVASTFSANDGSKPTCVSPKIKCVKGSVANDFNSAGLQAVTPGGSASNCNDNGVREGTERCDGSDIGTATCADAGFSGSAPANVPACSNCQLTQGSCTVPAGVCTSCTTWGAWTPATCTAGQQQTRTCATYPTECTAPSTPLTQSQPCSSGSWFNPAWNYRRQVDIQNPSATSYTSLSLEVTAAKPSNMAADCSDLRITDSGGTTELPFFIYNCGSTLGFYVNLQTLAANSGTTIYMYYGASSVASKSTTAGVLTDSSHSYTPSTQSSQTYERGLVFEPTQDMTLVSATIPTTTTGNLLTLYTWKNQNQYDQIIKTTPVINSIGYFNTKLSASQKYILSLKKSDNSAFSWDAYLGLSLPKTFNNIQYLNGWQFNGGDTAATEIYNIKSIQWAPALPFTPTITVSNEVPKG